MTKVRVQDATRELNASVSSVYEAVSKSRKQAQDALNALRKTEETLRAAERELQEQREREELKRQQEAAAAFLTAYSAEAPVEEAPSPAPAEQTQVTESAQIGRAHV